MRKPVLALLTTFLAAGHAQAPPSSIPFELDGGHIFVSVFVDGEGPYRFGFDTGASGMGRVDSRLTGLLSLPAAGQATTSDGVKSPTADLVSVRELRLGTLERRNVSVPSRDYNKGRPETVKPIMGIIGRDFFADRLVIIDYPRRTIAFSNGSLDPKSRDVLQYGPGFAVPVCFARGCYPAKIDTGSSRAIVVPKGLVGSLSTSIPTLVGQVRRTNSTASLYEMRLQEPLRVGAISATDQKLLYTEPSADVINIGSDFLKDYVLTIDQRRHLLRISKPVG